MTGTDITLKDVKDDLNQILDRLSEIEMILNDPMHGIELPEGVNVDVGEQPTHEPYSNQFAEVAFRSGGYLKKDNMNDS